MQGSIKRMIISMVVYTNITYCTRQFLTFDNQFPPTAAQSEIRPSKESSVRVATSSLLVRTTTGSGCDYWQTTSHISTAPGSNTTVNRCAIDTPYTATLLPSINEQVGVQWKQHLFLPSVFFFVCLLHWSCDLTQCAIQTRDHTNRLACIHYIHALGREATHAQEQLWSHNRALLF